VVVVDDLSTGHSEAVDSRATLIQASIHNKSAIVEALKGVETVIHCAAKSLVEESVVNPELYDQVNSAGTAALLEVMAEAKVFNIIFSSTAAVYGDSKIQPIAESSVINPVNPYGQSKVKAENSISNFCKEGFSAITFRYFNVAGSYQSKSGQRFVEDHKNETHLIPKIMKSYLKNPDQFKVEIYGDSWPTADGSCVRDYLHVEEALILIEKSILIVTDGNGVRMTLRQFYEIVLQLIDLPCYLTYTKLKVSLILSTIFRTAVAFKTSYTFRDWNMSFFVTIIKYRNVLTV
jgi:UDP-glucose 4-epimerase